MNQILSINMPNDNKNKKVKKDKQPIAIGSILKFFSIATIFFGIFMIGTGAYAIYENRLEIQEANIEPEISLEYKTDTSLLLKVTHQRAISRVEYYWNDDTATTISGSGGQYLEQEISLPAGQNTLHIVVQDITGKESTYDKEYDIESNISLEVVGDKIKIAYSNNDEVISYLTYRWDDEEEERIEIDDYVVDEEINVKKGLHTLTVIVVDEDNKTDTKVQKINGVSKPEVTVGIDDIKQHFVIKVSSESELSKVEIILDQDENQQYVLNLDGMELTSFEYTLPIAIHDGENFIEITAYNIENITGEAAVKLTK